MENEASRNGNVYHRIIPRLDIKGPNLVKGIHLEGLRTLGKPEDFAQIYYEAGADELLYMDAVASLYGRNTLIDIIEKTAKQIFIPLTVGGGLSNIDDINRVLRAGADKVSINTSAIQNPELIDQASKKFGSSTVVISIEAIEHDDGSFECYTDYGREPTGVEPVEWAREVEKRGAGEILITAIHREGTGRGFDVDLTRKISNQVEIPVIACGGAGKAEHLINVFREGKADAVSLASLLHYHYVQTIDSTSHDYSDEGVIDFLLQGGEFSKVDITALPELKKSLTEQNIPTRLTPEHPSPHE